MRESIISSLALLIALLPLATWAEPKADLVVDRKSQSRLYLMQGGRVIETFAVAFGAHPKGHKEREGDERTPEGRYVLDSKNAQSGFYRSIHISYPNGVAAVRLDRRLHRSEEQGYGCCLERGGRGYAHRDLSVVH